VVHHGVGAGAGRSPDVGDHLAVDRARPRRPSCARLALGLPAFLDAGQWAAAFSLLGRRTSDPQTRAPMVFCTSAVVTGRVRSPSTRASRPPSERTVVSTSLAWARRAPTVQLSRPRKAHLLLMLPPPARVAAVVEHVLRRKLAMLGAQVLVEHRRRLDDVVVDTRDDHVVHFHGNVAPPGGSSGALCRINYPSVLPTLIQIKSLSGWRHRRRRAPVAGASAKSSTADASRPLPPAAESR